MKGELIAKSATDKGYVAVIRTDNDVLCGCGKSNFSHKGNARLREIIRARSEVYIDAQTKLQRSQIVTEILNELLEQGTRFLYKETNNSEWYDGGIIMGMTKVCSSFMKLQMCWLQRSASHFPSQLLQIRHAVRNVIYAKLQQQQQQKIRNQNQQRKTRAQRQQQSEQGDAAATAQIAAIAMQNRDQMTRARAQRQQQSEQGDAAATAEIAAIAMQNRDQMRRARQTLPSTHHIGYCQRRLPARHVLGTCTHECQVCSALHF